MAIVVHMVTAVPTVPSICSDEFQFFPKLSVKFDDSVRLFPSESIAEIRRLPILYQYTYDSVPMLCA